MRIVYIHQYFNTPLDGGGTRSYEFARRLAAAGHDVHIVTSEKRSHARGRKWHSEEIEGFTVHRIDQPYDNAFSASKRIFAFLGFAARASRRARRLRGDVVFATSTPLTVIVPAAYATLGRATPLVFEVRDLWPELPIAVGALRNKFLILAARKLEKFAYARASTVVALSEGMKEGVVRAGKAEEDVVVIPNASDLALFDLPATAGAEWMARHPELEGRKLVAYAGTIGSINALEYLVDVALSVSTLDPSVAFVIAGRGGREAAVRAYAEKLGVLHKNVFMFDKSSKHDVAALLSATSAATSLFAPIPEMEANSANKFFDALAAGRPVLVNYGGWHRALVEEQAAGAYLDPQDPEEAGKKIVALLNDEALIAELGANARRLASERFSRDDLGRRFVHVIESAVPNAVR